jgi:hypothetical protein
MRSFVSDLFLWVWCVVIDSPCFLGDWKLYEVTVNKKEGRPLRY